MSEPPTKKSKKSKSNDKREKIGVLEDKTLLYFRRASDQLKEGFEDDEDKAAFLDNVFKETAKEEIKLARNQTVSRILEEMIAVANRSHIESFLIGFTENYHLICTDRFASHVTQALLHKSAETLVEEGELVHGFFLPSFCLTFLFSFPLVFSSSLLLPCAF